MLDPVRPDVALPDAGRRLVGACAACHAGRVGQDAVVVLEGRHADLDWQVLVSGDDRDSATMLHVHRRGRLVVSSGFGGPKPSPGDLVHEWRGRTDDLPYFVMVRADPLVQRVVAVTDQGSQVELALSPVLAAYSLRFAAAGLPEGEAPARLQVRTSTGMLPDVETPTPRFEDRPAIDPETWRAWVEQGNVDQSGRPRPRAVMHQRHEGPARHPRWPPHP